MNIVLKNESCRADTVPKRFCRFLGEMFGVSVSKSRVSVSVRIGSALAIFSYSMLGLGFLPLLVSLAFPMMSEAATQRLAISITIVLCVILIQEIPYMPRLLRLGILPAWVGIGMMVHLNRQDSSPFAITSESDCEIVTDREAPEAIFIDELDHAIREDLKALPSEDYLDLIYVAFLVHALSHTDWPLGGLEEALREIGLEGQEYEQFSTLARFRTREVESALVFDAWFCGFDLECGTCDDRGATYRWPENSASATVPSIWRDGKDLTSETSIPSG